MDDKAMMTPQPFPHAIRRNYWSPSLLTAIANEFPAYDDPRWITYPDAHEIGKKAGQEHMWGVDTKRWFAFVRSEDYIANLERLTGIKGLVADTWGGGLHCTGENGRLGMHTDFSVHPDHPTLVRRINHLTFVSPEWDREWGGILYLGANREVEIVPSFNTTVIFETSSKSWHGHPDPIVGAHLRKSLACYYYAPRRPDDDLLTTTVWQ